MLDKTQKSLCHLRRFLSLFILLSVFLGWYFPVAKCLAGEHNLSERAVGSIYVYDFGKVKEGKILKHDFLFKNASGKILNIKNTYTSCGCTVSKVKHKKVLPEKSTVISVSVDTRGYSGPIEQYAYVQTDDPAVLIITFVVKAWVER